MASCRDNRRPFPYAALALQPVNISFPLSMLNFIIITINTYIHIMKTEKISFLEKWGTRIIAIATTTYIFVSEILKIVAS